LNLDRASLDSTKNSEHWILTFKPGKVWFKKLCLSLRSWTLNPERVDYRFFFWILNFGPWIFYSERLDSGNCVWAFNLEFWIQRGLILEVFFEHWTLDLESSFQRG
jgi:hypothetical protein